jgi:CRP-like cAMP-binding protein
MKQNHKNLILCQSLFENCDRRLTEPLVISSGKLCSFRSGEEMKSDFTPSVGILLSGRGVIYSADKDRKTILKFISPGSMIGVAGIFAASPPNTRTVACGDGKSEMFFIPKESFEQLLESEPAFRQNLVSFLADRISFLNSKINCITAGSSERKLALFIISSPRNEDGTVDPGMSMTALAHALDLSRASLYRAFDALERAGIIKRYGKLITVISEEKLNEID